MAIMRKKFVKKVENLHATNSEEILYNLFII